MDFDLSYFLSLDPNLVPTNGMVHLSDITCICEGHDYVELVP